VTDAATDTKAGWSSWCRYGNHESCDIWTDGCACPHHTGSVMADVEPEATPTPRTPVAHPKPTRIPADSPAPRLPSAPEFDLRDLLQRMDDACNHVGPYAPARREATR
jgi:hypothetical protein